MMLPDQVTGFDHNASMEAISIIQLQYHKGNQELSGMLC